MTISVSGGLGLLQMVSEPNIGPCANEESKPAPKEGGHEAMCQQGRWVPKRDGLGVPYQLEKETSASEDAESRRRVGL